MAVNVTPKKDSKPEAQRTPKFIELTQYKRYSADVLGSGRVVYESGVQYEVTDEEAMKFLSHESEGTCPFRLFKAPKQASAVGAPPRAKPLPKPAVAVPKPADPVKPPEEKPTKLEIHDPSFEAEIAARAGGEEKDHVVEV